MSTKHEWMLTVRGRRIFYHQFQLMKSLIQRQEWQDYKIYHWNDQWQLVYTNEVDNTCGCGRSYGNRSEGTEFMLRLASDTSTPEKAISWLESPILCKFCYYSNEIKLGNWAPRAVKEELGLPVDYS